MDERKYGKLKEELPLRGDVGSLLQEAPFCQFPSIQVSLQAFDYSLSGMDDVADVRSGRLSDDKEDRMVMLSSTRALTFRRYSWRITSM